MRRSAILVASLALLATPDIAGAVTGGTPIADSAADSIVLVFDGEGGSQCSGALIAPDVVLTAAHCLSNPTGNFYVLGGLQPLQTALFTILASEVHLHPDFDPVSISHDIGILVLSSAAPATPLPWRVPDAGFYAPGTLVSILGFGGTTPSGNDAGIRRIGGASIEQTTTGEFVTDNTTGQGMCAGDSGGPALTTDEIIPPTIIGVASYGDQLCAQFSVFDRTDANAAFIAQFVPEPGAASAWLATGTLVLLARRRV